MSVSHSLTNTGTVDTTLLLGAVLGNGGKYMFGNVRLAVHAPGRAAEEYHYSPHDYPPAIGGTLGEWLQALPARSVFRVAATPDDFLLKGRLKAFMNGLELRLTVIVPEPRREAMLLKYWSGTLTSNTCVVD